MKRYKKRAKPDKSTKRMMAEKVRSMEATVFMLENNLELSRHYLKTARDNLGLEVIRSRGYHDELLKLREKLAKVTEPAWRYASLHLNPAKGFSPDERVSLWEINGSCHIAIAVEFRHVRSMPRGDRAAYLSILVDDFTKKAREHAIENFKILIDQ